MAVSEEQVELLAATGVQVLYRYCTSVRVCISSEWRPASDR